MEEGGGRRKKEEQGEEEEEDKGRRMKKKEEADVERSRRVRRRRGDGEAVATSYPIVGVFFSVCTSHQCPRYMNRPVLVIGLRVIVIVDLYSFVFIGLRVVVFVDHHASFSCRFWKPPCAGEVLPNFSLIMICFFFCRAGPIGEDPEHLGDPTPIIFVGGAVLPA